MLRIGSILYALIFTTIHCFSQNNYSILRENMVAKQLVPREINDSLTLIAMSKVPRHKFVPASVQALAYEDGALAIGHGQTISQPFIVAYMTQNLQLNTHSKVLEIGTGSGYQAAVLAEIVDSVYTIEIVPSLGKKANELLKRLGYTNILLKIGDGYNGWEKYAPFDAIIITAGIEEIPQPLLDQLIEGGLMILPLGPHNSTRQLILIEKTSKKIKTTQLIPVRFVPFTREKKHE